jgi:hypothetical protein
MTNSTDFYAHADQSRRDAAASNLPNVRERLERSAAAWDDMGARALRSESARDKKAEEQAVADRLASAGVTGIQND